MPIGPIRVEPLESRCLLAAELIGMYQGYPKRLTPAPNGDLYYTLDETPHLSRVLELRHRDASGEEHRVLPYRGRVMNLTNGLYLTPVGNKVFFFAEDGEGLRRLWVISPKKNRATPLLLDAVADVENPPVVFRGQLYFSASDGAGGQELWKSDGTREGTVRVADLVPGAGDSDPEYLTVTKDAIFFAAKSPQTTWQLFRSDGSAKGTVLVRESGATRRVQHVRALADGRIFFATDGAEQRVWVSDGTDRGTVALPGEYASPVWDLTPVGSRLYFTADSAAFGREVWVTDGTVVGTKRLTDLEAGPTDGVTSFSTGRFTALGQSLVFSTFDDNPEAFPSSHGGSTNPAKAVPRVWKVGPRGKVTKLYGGKIRTVVTFKDRVFFGGDSGLWQTDGTRPGTQLQNRFGRDPAAGTDSLYYAVNQEIWKLKPPP
jgi:ELWxxDGT repeat protein